MTRRELVKLLSGIVIAWPLVARAQQRTPRLIGILGAERDGLEFVDSCFCHPPARTRLDRGRYYRSRVSWAYGSSERVSDFTAEFLRRNVDAIVTYASAAARKKTKVSLTSLLG